MPRLLRFPISTPAGLYFPRPAATATAARRAQDASGDQTAAHERRRAGGRTHAARGGPGSPASATAGDRKQVAGTAAPRGSPAAAASPLPHARPLSRTGGAAPTRTRPRRRGCPARALLPAGTPMPGPRRRPRSLKKHFSLLGREKKKSSGGFISFFFFSVQLSQNGGNWRRSLGNSPTVGGGGGGGRGRWRAGRAHANSRPPAPPRLGCACV